MMKSESMEATSLDMVGSRFPIEPESVLDEIMSVGEAAEFLGISRSAVIHAANMDRIVGKKVGKSWALVRRSVLSYEVTACRVAAGHAAHRARAAMAIADE